MQPILLGGGKYIFNQTPDMDKESVKPSNGSGTAGNGSPADAKKETGKTPQTLTTRQGHPVTDNQNLRTVGNRGPATMENYHFLEKMSHFDRERIPERVVLARGDGAHGVFEAYGTVGG